ncbi:hypothetical protein NQ318_022992 [Aromia moschata]|uniref:Uncharacterized protein n=1 Tax=Aromia moschata TaxID=1265417 RepID=A0AAV8YCV0_9CUCU|nr:hypothetical protein NQ318_022992 [Aromia moschata]
MATPLAATSSVPLFTRSKLITRRNRQDAYFVNKILFTDEATFTRRGIFNRKNCHIWANQNPNANWVRHFQHEFKINIWCGIIGVSCGSFRTPSKIDWSGLSKLPSRKFSRFTRRSSFRRSC